MQRAESIMHIVAGFAVGQQRFQSGGQRLRLAFILSRPLVPSPVTEKKRLYTKR